MATTTTLSDINGILKESDQKLDTISNRIGKWLQGEGDQAGDRLEAERRAQRTASRAQRAAAVISSRSSQSATAPDASTFRDGFMQGALGVAGVTSVASFASGLMTSIFGDRRLKTNLAASAGRMLGRGTMYGSMALAVSTFGEDVIGNFLNGLDPNNVTFTEEQKQDIASRTTDGVTSTLVASMFTRNPWVRLAAFVGGAFGDEIYTGIENAFGQENLTVNNPFGIGPDELDFTQGPLKQAMVMAVPLLAAGLLRVAGKALITRLAIPLTAGAAVGILDAIGWKGLANLIDVPNVPGGTPTTPGTVPSTRPTARPPGTRPGGVAIPNSGPGTAFEPLGAGGKANKVIDAIQRVAALSDDAIAAIREAGYGVNSAGRLYNLTNGRLLSLDNTISLIDGIRPPSVFTRGATLLRNSRIGAASAEALSALSNSWVGKTGRFLGRNALPLSAGVEGTLGYFDPQMNAAGMGGFDRATTGLASGMVGQTGDMFSWLFEKAVQAVGGDVDVADFSEALKNGAVIRNADGGTTIYRAIQAWANEQAGLDPFSGTSLQPSVMDIAGSATGGSAGLDRLQQSIEDALGADNFYTDSLGRRVYSLGNDTGSIMDQYFNGTPGGGQGGIFAPTVNEGSVVNNNFNSGYVVEGTPTDGANGGSNFGFVGGGGVR